MREPEMIKSRNTPSVLIVEDEGIIALDIERQTMNAGFAIAGKAQTAEQALQLIDIRNPDVVLMDIRLKGKMDGIQAASIIRERYALPVIYLTSHADEATLSRAQETEPFGYLIKPLSTSSIKATITIAVHKHRLDREVKGSRALLSTILQGLPYGVIATDSVGKVAFLNRAAEAFTQWTLQEASGYSLTQIAPIQNSHGEILSLRLLQETVRRNTQISIPSESKLATRTGQLLDITGHYFITNIENGPPAVFISFYDITNARNVSHAIEQEQQMRSIANFAEGVGCEFYALFDLIQSLSPGLSTLHALDETVLLRKAVSVGVTMSTQLLEIKAGNGSLHAVNVAAQFECYRSQLQRLCGTGIELKTRLRSDLGYVVCTGNHFEQLLTHLALEGKERLRGEGELALGADISNTSLEPRASVPHVRLFARAQEMLSKDFATGELPLFENISSGLSLVALRAIANASAGFVKVTELDESSLIEVFLPQYPSREAASTAALEHTRSILTVGFPREVTALLAKRIADEALLLNVEHREDAASLTRLYEGGFELIVFNGSIRPEKEGIQVPNEFCGPKQTILSIPLQSGISFHASAIDLEGAIREALNKRSSQEIATAR
jgi:CheY-like chemotaxis protein